jgi:hypothetical protein
MPSVFESLFAAAGAPVVAGTHGRTLSFTPKGGSARNVQATAVKGDVTTLVTLPSGMFWEDAILVSIDKDPDGGIDAINLGDGITYNGRGYSYAGQIADELSDRWTIRFINYRPCNLGGNFQPR